MTAETVGEFAVKHLAPMMAANPATVICPVHNNLELTMGFVLNMLQYVKPPDELLIVVNGCTDATAAFLKTMEGSGHNVHYVVSNKNLGFGAGNNLGARHASNPIHVFLSNDVEADGEFLPQIVSALSLFPHAVVGARLLDFHTGWNTFRAKKEIRWKFADITFSPGSRITIPYIEGWCVAAHSHHYYRNPPQTRGAAGGLWDDRYWLDYEDVDVSMQAHVSGGGLFSLPLLLRHERTGQTANRVAGGRLAMTTRSRAAFMEKWGLEPYHES